MNYYILVSLTIALLIIAAIGALVFVKDKTFLRQAGHILLHWSWAPALLYWIIFSAGVFSELCFLIASIWKSVNASDHDFVLLFMSELQSKQTTYWANSSYIVLSVCILPLAVYVTYGHAKTWIYEKKWLCASALWTLLYGAPALTFLVIDLAIMSHSETAYVLPDYLSSARTIMAYAYGLTAILYHYAGKEQEADRLRKKDDFISQLVENNRVALEQIEALKAEMDRQKQETEQQKQLLAESKNQQRALKEEIQKSDDDALQPYGEECIAWLHSGIKTATIEEITRFTGHSKRKISNANLQRSPRNPDLILISSLVNWLKNTPVPTGKTETNIPALHVVSA